MKRAIVIVLDSLGCGELPDADLYEDQGAHTIDHIAEAMEGVGGWNIPHMKALGFGNITGIEKVTPEENPKGAYGRLAEASNGKDTITGHWEIAGLLTEEPFQTFERFPEEFIRQLEERCGLGTLGNYASSGTEIIETYAEEQKATGKLIVYTSADSVFQVAANTAVIPLEKLYECCEIARELLAGPWQVGRVIARPYVEENGGYRRTADRKDYSVAPPGKTMMDLVKEAGKMVFAVGKIEDIFDGQGVVESLHNKDNMDGVDHTITALKQDFEGVIFTNLVDFDSLYGHRRDAVGYGRCLEEFDARLPEIYEAMKEEDILILCADHGNDPVHHGWNHTREYVPLLVYGKNVKEGVDLGTGTSFADIGATVCDYVGAEPTDIGQSFLNRILKS
ncbi:MAG: phosphopentomutase [Firmicutes bacterium]|nr:phosphopentomutase [Bacillota bacterium]